LNWVQTLTRKQFAYSTSLPADNRKGTSFEKKGDSSSRRRVLPSFRELKNSLKDGRDSSEKKLKLPDIEKIN